MMTELQMLYPYYLGAAALLVALLALLTATRTARRYRSLEGELEHRLEEAERTLKALCSGSVGMGERLRASEKNLRRLVERQDRLSLKDSGEGPFIQAIRLVQTGADVERITRNCGVTRSEAELIVRLYGLDKAV